MFSIPPHQKLTKDKTRSWFHVKNKLLFQCLLLVVQKHIYCLLGTQKRIYKSTEKQGCIYADHTCHIILWFSLCKAESFKGIEMIVPKSLSGISGASEAVSAQPIQPTGSLGMQSPQGQTWR